MPLILRARHAWESMTSMPFEHPRAFDTANPLQRGLRRAAASAPGSKVFARVLHHVDKPVARMTRGRHTAASVLAGLPIVMLTTTGAKSGKQRTVPLLGLPVDGGIAVIASNYGQPRQPAWYYNLRADPSCSFSVDGVERRGRAVEATGARRDEIWQRGLKIYPGWAKYEVRAAHRTIHVFVLEPVE